MKKHPEMRLRSSDKQKSGQDCPVPLGTSIDPVYGGNVIISDICVMTCLHPCSFWFSCARCSVMSHKMAKITQPVWNWQFRQEFSFILHEKSNVLPKLKKSFEDFAPTQPPHFCMVWQVLMHQVHLLQEQLELVIQATCPNEIYSFHDRVHYMIHLQHLSTQSFLMGNAVIRYQWCVTVTF